MQSEYCPLCSKNGAKVRVRSYQLNMQQAVFMCSTQECTWPVGYHELLFMDRPLGKYWTEDWPKVADEFLAEHLKKQRDSLSELSAYTPPQTPGSSKDAIHDTASTASNTAAGSSSLPMVKEIDALEQQPSTSKSKPFDIPVLDFTGDNMYTVEMMSTTRSNKKIDALEQQPSTSKSKPFDLPVLDCTGDNAYSVENMTTTKSKPFDIPVLDFTGDNAYTGENMSFEIPVIDCTDSSTSTFDNKAASLESISGLKSEKSHVKVLLIKKENSSTKVFSKSGSTLKNSFSMNSVPLVNSFNKNSVLLVNKSVEIKDEKSSSVPEKSAVVSDNVQCKKFRILGKQKPKSFTYKKQFDIFDDIKKAKSTNEQCKPKVTIKSRIDLDKMKPNEIRDVLFVNSKSKTNNLIKGESTEVSVIKLEPAKQLIKIEKKVSQSDVNNQVKIEEKQSDANSLIQSLTGDQNCKVAENVSLELPKKESSINDDIPYDFNLMMNSPAEFESDKNWSADHHDLDSLLAMLEDDTTENNLMAIHNNTASATDDTLPSESLKIEKIGNDAASDLKMEVDSIIDDDTLQCTIDEDTDDSFFASLFSPPMKQ